MTAVADDGFEPDDGFELETPAPAKPAERSLGDELRGFTVPGLMEGLSDAATAIQHGVTSGPIGKSIMRTLGVSGDELAQGDKAAQEAASRSPVAGSLGNAVGEMHSPEGLATGELIGPAARMLGKAVAPVVKPVARGFGEWLQSVAGKSAAKTLGGTAGDYKALGADRIRQLGQWLLDKGAVKFGDKASSVAERLPGLKEEAGRELGDSISALDETGRAGLDKMKLAQSFRDAAAEAAKKGPAAEPIVQRYLRAAEKVEKAAAESPTGSFSEGEAWKRGYQEAAYPKGRAPLDPTPRQAADMEIAATAKKHIEDAAEEAAQGAPSFDDFMAAKRSYGNAAEAERIAKGAAGRAMARNMASPSDKAAALAELAAHGNPLTAVGAGVLNKQVRTRTAASVATTANAASRASLGVAAKLEQLAASSPAIRDALGPNMLRALAADPQAFIAAHAARMNLDPQYRMVVGPALSGAEENRQ